MQNLLFQFFKPAFIEKYTGITYNRNTRYKITGHNSRGEPVTFSPEEQAKLYEGLVTFSEQMEREAFPDLTEHQKRKIKNRLKKP